MAIRAEMSTHFAFTDTHTQRQTHTHRQTDTHTQTHTYTNEIIYKTSCDTRALHGLPVLSIPLEAHHKAQSSEIFLSFLVKN